MRNKRKIKPYEPPKIEIALLEQADIVTSSGGSTPEGYGPEGNTGFWT